MSNATKQSLAILGVIHGGIKAARDCFSHGPQIDEMMQRAADAVQAVTVWWPISGDELAHWEWVTKKLTDWETVLKTKDQKWSIVANISVSMVLLEDLAQTSDGGEEETLRIAFYTLNGGA